MNFETTKDVLDHAREFHGQVSEYYRQLSEKVQKERVKMLLEYMSRHEKHLEENLSNYEEDVSGRILNAWFQYPPPKDILKTVVSLTLEGKENLTVDEVIELALRIDGCVIQLYQKMAADSKFVEVKEVFTNLLEMEKHREMDLVRDALHLKEI